MSKKDEIIMAIGCIAFGLWFGIMCGLYNPL